MFKYRLRSRFGSVSPFAKQISQRLQQAYDALVAAGKLRWIPDPRSWNPDARILDAVRDCVCYKRQSRTVRSSSPDEKDLGAS
jgi:hypothetical protein